MSERAPTNPADNNGPSRPNNRLQKIKGQAKQRWDNRPSLLELHYFHLPMAVIIAGCAIGVVDEVAGTGLAENMAKVAVDSEDGRVEQVWDKLVHEIGSAAVDFKD